MTIGDDDDLPLGGDEHELPVEEAVVEEELDAPEDEAEAQPQAQPEQPAKALSPAQARIQQEIARRKQVEDELNEQRRLVADYQRRQYEAEQARAAPAAPVEDPLAEQRRLDEMSPAEQVRYMVQKELRGTQEHIRQMQLEAAITKDKAMFREEISKYPDYAHLEEAVEKFFDDRLRAGAPENRNTIFKYLLGEEVMKNAAAATAKAKKAAASNTARVTTKPPSARSNVGGERGEKLSAGEVLRRRLENGEY